VKYSSLIFAISFAEAAPDPHHRLVRHCSCSLHVSSGGQERLSRGAEIAGADRLVVVSRIGLMQLMPISHRDKILSIPGVKAVTHNHWFGGVYQDEKNFFPQFVIDPENQRQV